MNARAAEYRLLIEDVIAGGLLEEDEIAALREILTSARARNGTREPIPAEETTMTPGERDESEFGGESPADVMKPGPQYTAENGKPAPDDASKGEGNPMKQEHGMGERHATEQPAPDDESKKGSG